MKNFKNKSSYFLTYLLLTLILSLGLQTAAQANECYANCDVKYRACVQACGNNVNCYYGCNTKNRACYNNCQ